MEKPVADSENRRTANFLANLDLGQGYIPSGTVLCISLIDI